MRVNSVLCVRKCDSDAGCVGRSVGGSESVASVPLHINSV